MKRVLLTFSLAALTTFACAQLPSEYHSIGYAEWVNPQTVGVPPSTLTERMLEHGIELELDEQVTTGDAGAADFQFVNRDRLLVGPRCSVALNRSFYDPELDLDVREFGLSTVDICLAKADLAISGGRVVIRAQGLPVEIRNADATIYAAAGELAASSGGGHGLPDASRGAGTSSRVADARFVVRSSSQQRGPLPLELGDARLIVKTDSVGEGGYVTVAGQTIRRSGFFVAVLGDGTVLGPERATPELIAALNSRLEGVVPPDQRPAWTAPWVLADVRNIPELAQPLLISPQSCVFDECEFRKRREDQFEFADDVVTVDGSSFDTLGDAIDTFGPFIVEFDVAPAITFLDVRPIE